MKLLERGEACYGLSEGEDADLGGAFVGEHGFEVVHVPHHRVFQGDSNTDIMQAPKVTIFNGQHAGMMVGQKQPFVTEYRVVREKDQVAVKPHVETLDLGLRCGLLLVVT